MIITKALTLNKTLENRTEAIYINKNKILLCIYNYLNTIIYYSLQSLKIETNMG